MSATAIDYFSQEGRVVRCSTGDNCEFRRSTFQCIQRGVKVDTGIIFLEGSELCSSGTVCTRTQEPRLYNISEAARWHITIEKLFSMIPTHSPARYATSDQYHITACGG